MKQSWRRSLTKNLNVLGPLGKLSLAVDAVNNHKGPGEPPKLSVKEAQHLLEQSILLLGQTHNYLL